MRARAAADLVSGWAGAAVTGATVCGTIATAAAGWAVRAGRAVATTTPPCRTLAALAVATAPWAAAIAPLSCPRLGFLAMLPAWAPLVGEPGLSIVIQRAKNTTVATSNP